MRFAPVSAFKTSIPALAICVLDFYVREVVAEVIKITKADFSVRRSAKNFKYFFPSNARIISIIKLDCKKGDILVFPC